MPHDPLAGALAAACSPRTVRLRCHLAFRSFFLALTPDQRDVFARRALSTRGVLTQVAYGNKPVELGFADVLVTLGAGQLTLDDVPLTERAQRQRAIREGREAEEVRDAA